MAPVVLRCRPLSNGAVEQRTTWWGRGQGKRAPSYQQALELPDRKAPCPDYGDGQAQMVHDVLRRVDKTYHAFGRRTANGEAPGSPRVQGPGRSSSCTSCTSCTSPQYGKGATGDGGVLSLAQIGRLLNAHAPASSPRGHAQDGDGEHRSGWLVGVVLLGRGTSRARAAPRTRAGHGCRADDVGRKVVRIPADGETVQTPRQARQADQQRANAQRGGARRKQGRTRRTKAVQVLARKQQQGPRQRTDLHPNTALALLRQDEVLSLDDVRVATLVRNRHLAKSIRAAGGAAFPTLLAGKAVYAGKRVVAVPPADPSQDWRGVLADGSRWPQRVANSLSVRPPVCPCCGLGLDRDEHAAQTMRRAGQAPQASPWPGAASVA